MRVQRGRQRAGQASDRVPVVAAAEALATGVAVAGRLAPAGARNATAAGGSRVGIRDRTEVRERPKSDASWAAVRPLVVT